MARTLRMKVVWDVMEEAKVNRDDVVLAACRRLIHADRLGWKSPHRHRDWALVKMFAE